MLDEGMPRGQQILPILATGETWVGTEQGRRRQPLPQALRLCRGRGVGRMQALGGS